MFTDLLDAMGGMGTLGLCLTVAFLAFSETAILLDLAVPGEVGLVLAGAAASQGHHPVALVAVAAALGALSGDSVSYAIGRRWGRAVIERFELTRRLGPLVDDAERYFQRRGGHAIFLGRWVGALRAVVPFVAGMGRLPVTTFLVWNLAASASWSTVVVLLGWTFGESVASTVDRMGAAVSVVVVALLVLAWLTHRRRSSSRGPTDAAR